MIFLTPIILLIGHSFLSGLRAVLISYLISFYFYYLFRYKKQTGTSFLKYLLYLVLFFFVYVIVNLIPIVRSSSDGLEMIKLFQDYVSENGLAFLQLQNSGELQTSINLMKLQDGILSGRSSFNYGQTVLNDLMVFIPRVFYDNRPLPTSELFALKFYPEIFSEGGGMGMFFLIDGYWSFGVFGVFIFSFLFACLLGVLYKSLYRNIHRKLSSFILFIIFFQIFIVSSVRGGMVLSLRTFIMNSFIIYFLALLSKYIKVFKFNGSR
jgi:oligosaccharide repeat unit polymerase